jgi:D-arabinose 5-phosphate isomerase GutQ
MILVQRLYFTELSKNIGSKIALVAINTQSELSKDVDAFINLPSVSNLKN